MALIQKQHKVLYKNVAFRMEESVRTELYMYAKYLDRPVGEVVALAMKHVMAKDDEFVAMRTGAQVPVPKRSRKATGGPS